MRQTAITYSALLASRLPWRFRRWWTLLPEEAGMGAAPHRCAKAASFSSRSGVSPAAINREAGRVGLCARAAAPPPPPPPRPPPPLAGWLFYKNQFDQVARRARRSPQRAAG